MKKNNKVDVRAETAPGYKEIITDVAILQTKGRVRCAASGS